MIDRSTQMLQTLHEIIGGPRPSRSNPQLTDGEGVLVAKIIQVIKDHTWCAGGFDDVELQEVEADMAAMLIAHRALEPEFMRSAAQK